MGSSIQSLLLHIFLWRMYLVLQKVSLGYALLIVIIIRITLFFLQMSPS